MSDPRREGSPFRPALTQLDGACVDGAVDHAWGKAWLGVSGLSFRSCLNCGIRRIA